MFDFASTSSPGWSTGGGNPPYAFTWHSGSTDSSDTGPSSGYGGSGNYYYAEVSSPRSPGDVFELAYDDRAWQTDEAETPEGRARGRRIRGYVARLRAMFNLE